MKPSIARVAVVAGLSSVLVMFSSELPAQNASSTLSGTVIDVAGKVVAGAKVSVENAATGQSTDTQTNSDGLYSVSNLAAGDYEVSITGAGFETKTAALTLAAGTSQTINLTVTAVQNQSGPPVPATSSLPSDNLPNAPSSSNTEPSLEDLGFSKTDTQSDAKRQALLDKRTRMLKTHQRLGLITAIPLVATVITSVGAGGKSTSTTSRDLHVALGGVTGDLYFATAYYAIRAPRVPGTETRGPIRVHKVLAWIHGPGMILTPILGAMAFSQKSNGEKVHGIAAAHGPVAIVTAGAYGAALLVVSLKF